MDTSVVFHVYEEARVSVFNETDYKYLYENLERYFLVWYLPLVMFVGTLGGTFCLVFLLLSHLFPRHILLWMVAICVGDLLVLYTDTLRMTLKVLFNYDIRDNYDILCKLHTFASNYFFYWSGYMQAMMSLQRLYFVLYPLQARLRVKERTVYGLIGGCSVLLVLPLWPYLVFWRPNPRNRGDCEPVVNSWYQVTSILDFVAWGLIPLVSMTISTLFISAKVLNWRYNCFRPQEGPRGKNDFNSNSEENSPSLPATPTPQRGTSTTAQLISLTLRRLSHRAVGLVTPGAPVTPVQRHGGPENFLHVTRLLIIINVFYMCATYPFLIYLLVLNFSPLNSKVGVTIPQKVHKFFYYLLRSICFLNCAFNWVFYCAAGKIFRKKAVHILRRITMCRDTPESTLMMELPSFRGGANRSRNNGYHRHHRHPQASYTHSFNKRKEDDSCVPTPCPMRSDLQTREEDPNT